MRLWKYANDILHHQRLFVKMSYRRFPIRLHRYPSQQQSMNIPRFKEKKISGFTFSDCGWCWYIYLC